MAINPASQYPGQITPSSTDYPYGSARDVSSPGAGDGTPVQQAWVNDWFGFQQAAMQAAGITPSGNPDSATSSDVLNAIRTLSQNRSQSFFTGGSFTVPPGVTSIYISAAAGGGGGGSGATNNGGQSSLVGGGGGGGGGAGQSIYKKAYTVTPGQIIDITVGSGGEGGVGSTAGAGKFGGNGGATVIGTLITLAPGLSGGPGQAVQQNVAGNGGAGGSGGTGYPNGQFGSDGNYTGNGGNGASSPFGGGGNGSRAATGTTDAGGSAYGFGGGGGGSGGGYGQPSVNVSSGSGGNGAPGIVIIEW